MHFHIVRPFEGMRHKPDFQPIFLQPAKASMHGDVRIRPIVDSIILSRFTF